MTRWAEAARRSFDALSARPGSVTLVTALAVLTILTAALQDNALRSACGEPIPQPEVAVGTPPAYADAATLPIELIRLEVTFSASRFVRIFGSADRCAPNVERSFVTWDALFPLAYGPLLCALFLWAERWRRFTVDDAPLAATPSIRRDLIAIAPLVAAALDIAVENLSLWYAGRFIANPDAATLTRVRIAVMLGSAGALAKWLLLFASAGGIVAELLSGPRGVILRRLRFSVLAVVLGGVPLIAVPQGQDILQRLFEDEHPVARLLLTAVPPIVFGAFAVWYFGRKLTELRLDRGPAAAGGWYEFFGEHIPRMLGVASLVLGGLAFARAGTALLDYVVFTVVAFFAAHLTRLFFARPLDLVGRHLIPRAWAKVPTLCDRLGQSVLASIVAVGVALAPFAEPADRTTWYLRVAAYLCVVSAWFFQLFVAFRRAARNARTGAAMPAHPTIDSIDLKDLGLAVKVGVATAAVASVVFLIAFTTTPVRVGRELGSLWILSIAVVNAVFIGSVSVWAGRRFQVPVVTVSLVLALLFSLWNDNHVVTTLAGGQDTIAGRRTIDEQFASWLATSHPNRPSGEVPVVLVAAAGGGLRAAYWTAMSLAAIADELDEIETHLFERHLFAFSGVSGGSLGGALFVALARDRRDRGLVGCTGPATGRKFFATCVDDFMRDDYLSPVLAKLVAPDFLQFFLPFPVPRFDRSRALEQSWAESYRQVTGRPTFEEGFLALAQSARAIAPALLFNSTHVETGRRYVAASVYRSRATSGVGQPLQDAGDILDILRRDMPLSGAVHNSARFTYVSPSGHLETDDGLEYGRVVDGGYFENSGLASLREVYEILRNEGARPYVLYLCNDPLVCGQPSSPYVTSSAADEVAAPVRALLKTRDARGSLAQANLENLAGATHFLQMNVCRDLPPPEPADPAATEETEKQKNEKAKERVVSPPLGWLLSSLARDWMDRSLTQSNGRAESSDCYTHNAWVIDQVKAALATTSAR